MATWGTKTFEDDIAVDWISELVETEETREVLLSAITLPEESEEVIDHDTAVTIIAASEVIIALLDEPRKGLPEEVKDWLGDNECDDITDLPDTAIIALEKALAEDSELVSSWSEQEDFDEWKEGVDELREIMEQLVQA